MTDIHETSLMVARDLALGESASDLLSWVRQFSDNAELSIPKRILAAYVGVDMYQGFGRAALAMDPPISPDESCRLYLEKMRVTESDDVLGFLSRAPTSPLAARLFFTALLDHLPPRKVPKGNLGAMLRFISNYTKGMVGLGSFPRPSGEGKVSWVSLAKSRKTDEFSAWEEPFLVLVKMALTNPGELLANVPRDFRVSAEKGDETSDKVERPSSLIDALRFLCLLYSTCALESAARLQDKGDIGDPAEMLETLSLRLGNEGVIGEAMKRTPVLCAVATNWLSHPKAAPTMILEFCHLCD